MKTIYWIESITASDNRVLIAPCGAELESLADVWLVAVEMLHPHGLYPLSISHKTREVDDSYRIYGKELSKPFIVRYWNDELLLCEHYDYATLEEAFEVVKEFNEANDPDSHVGSELGFLPDPHLIIEYRPRGRKEHARTMLDTEFQG